MRRIDFRSMLGLGLILLGGLLLLEQAGIINGVARISFGLAIFLVAVYFLYLFIKNPAERWWAVIPSLVLFGISTSAILPPSLADFGGGIFLTALGLAFLIVYLTNRARWWGIIPGGVFLTLALVAVVDKSNWINVGELFFGGMGLTFLLVAILPNPLGKMQWAYIPAIVLILIAVLLTSQATAGLENYIWPVLLILAGLVVVASFFIQKD